MFNKKTEKINELETKVKKLNNEKEKLKELLTVRNEVIEELINGAYKLPEGCKFGGYCAACEYSKQIVIPNTSASSCFVEFPNRFSNSYNEKVATICGKGGACKNFLQKKIDDPRSGVNE